MHCCHALSFASARFSCLITVSTHSSIWCLLTGGDWRSASAWVYVWWLDAYTLVAFHDETTSWVSSSECCYSSGLASIAHCDTVWHTYELVRILLSLWYIQHPFNKTWLSRTAGVWNIKSCPNLPITSDVIMMYFSATKGGVIWLSGLLTSHILCLIVTSLHKSVNARVHRNSFMMLLNIKWLSDTSSLFCCDCYRSLESLSSCPRTSLVKA